MCQMSQKMTIFRLNINLGVVLPRLTFKFEFDKLSLVTQKPASTGKFQHH
jgi:hypothetical protein